MTIPIPSRLPGIVPFPPERVKPGFVGVEALCDRLTYASVDLLMCTDRAEVRRIAAEVRLMASQIEALAED